MDSPSSTPPEVISSAFWLLVALVVIFSVALSAAICFCVKVHRGTTRLYRLIFRFASDADSSRQTVASPDTKGQLEPPVWCRTCNEYCDHVVNMCPHVGKKLYSSSLQRRYYEFWRRQFFRSIRRTDTNSWVAPNCTVDLDELINGNRQNQSIDRQASTASMTSIALCQTSTPDRDQSHQLVDQDQIQPRMGRVESILAPWRNRRRESGASSGIGSSIGSVDEEEEELQQNLPTKFGHRLISGPRRWASELIGRSSGASKIVRRPTPHIMIHRCSSRRQMTTVRAPLLPNGLLRPDGDWNGKQTRREKDGIQRTVSQPCDTRAINHQPSPHLKHSMSSIPNVRAFLTMAFSSRDQRLGQQVPIFCDKDRPMISHGVLTAVPFGPGSK